MDCLENEIMLAAVAARSGLHHLSCYHYASEYDNIIFSAIFSVNCFCGMILRETNRNLWRDFLTFLILQAFQPIK